MSKDIQSYKFIEKLKSFPFVDEIWLFGSRARGDNHERADIDLAIICPNATDKDWSSVLRVIEEPDTLLKIDCVKFDRLREDDVFRRNILRFKKVLYKKEGTMTEFLWKDSLEQLGNIIAGFKKVMEHPELNTSGLMRDCAIKRFEYTIEFFWKTLKKTLSYENIYSNFPREVLSKVYQFRLIDDEAVWLRMLDSRNSISHIYTEEDIKRIFESIKPYLPVFEKTYSALKERYNIA